MFDCSHSYPELNRTQMWEKIKQFSNDLLTFLQSLPKIQALKVLAGLALTQDEETNQFLLQVAVQCICTLKGMS